MPIGILLVSLTLIGRRCPPHGGQVVINVPGFRS
jgi:hypothetical protein